MRVMVLWIRYERGTWECRHFLLANNAFIYSGRSFVIHTPIPAMSALSPWTSIEHTTDGSQQRPGLIIDNCESASCRHRTYHCWRSRVKRRNKQPSRLDSLIRAFLTKNFRILSTLRSLCLLSWPTEFSLQRLEWHYYRVHSQECSHSLQTDCPATYRRRSSCIYCFPVLSVLIHGIGLVWLGMIESRKYE